MKMTEALQNKFDQAVYGYDPNQYMPIYEDGELANRSAFIAYKLRRTGQHIAHAATLVTRRAFDVASE